MATKGKMSLVEQEMACWRIFMTQPGIDQEIKEEFDERLRFYIIKQIRDVSFKGSAIYGNDLFREYALNVIEIMRDWGGIPPYLLKILRRQVIFILFYNAFIPIRFVEDVGKLLEFNGMGDLKRECIKSGLCEYLN